MRDPGPTAARGSPSPTKRLAKICFLPREVPVRLVPRDPRHQRGRCLRSRSMGASASTARIDVERRRESLCHPGPCLERSHEDLLRRAGLLLERRPRHLQVARDDGAALDVRSAGILGGVDAVDRVAAVDLRAVGRQADERRRSRARKHQRGRHRHGRKTHVPSDPHRAPPSGGTRVLRPGTRAASLRPAQAQCRSQPDQGQPPLIAAITSTREPDSSAVPSSARCRSTYTLMCRRRTGPGSQSLSRRPGQRCVEAFDRLVDGRRRRRRPLAADREHERERGGEMDARHRYANAATSTDEIAGR